MRPILAAFCIILIGSSCANLDSNLFNPETDIEEYLLNGFEGEQEISLPEGEYVIDDSMIFRLNIPYIDDQGNPSTLSAVYVGDTSRIGVDSVILYFHGNSGNIDFYWNRTRLLAHIGGRHRMGVLIIDFPGYGLSEGDPSIENLILAATGAGEWLTDRGLQENRLFIYGFSLGSIPSLQTETLLKGAGEQEALCNKLILEAPIGSIQTMVEDASGLSFDAAFFTSYHNNSNIESIKSISQAVYILHGTEDAYLSIESHGIPLADAYQGQELAFSPIDGAKHGDLPAVLGFENYLTLLERFIFQ